MNVAVVSFGLRPEGGGGHTFQWMLLDALQDAAGESQHRFLFYLGGDPGDLHMDYIKVPFNRLARARRSAIIGLRDFQDRRNAPRLPWRTWFEKSLEQNDIDLVWFISHYLEECDQPFICTIWDLAHLEQPWFPEVSQAGEWERRHVYFSRYLPKATRIIVPNRAGREVLLRNFPVGDARVMEIPFPTPDFGVAPAKRHGASGLLRRHDIVQPYLFYPAQFWAHKNHFNAFRTLKALDRKTEESFQLVCVGSDKGQLDYVKALARELDVADQVRFLGFVETEELVDLYRQAHALLYLSFFGPENLPPLEALALGCPVVCADVFGMREQLRDAALFTPPTDPEAASDQIVALRDPGLRRRMREAGRRRAGEMSPAQYVSKVVSFLDQFEVVRRCWS